MARASSDLSIRLTRPASSLSSETAFAARLCCVSVSVARSMSVMDPFAIAAEAVEYLLVQRHNLRYGGSGRAFWGAIAGGIVGVMVGLPVPVVGSLIAGFLGTFAGAALVTFMETRKLDSASRVGWGVLLGRMWAAAVKTAAGVAILVMGAAAFLR